MAGVRAAIDVAPLVAQHHQAVYRYAFRLTGAVQDAEDLTQHVFLTAQRKIEQLRNAQAAESWLFSILRNAFLRERTKRRPALAADLDVRIDRIPAQPPGEEIDETRLQETLDRLPDHFRLVVLMFYFEECSYRQIAEALEIPIGTVMSRLARAKAALMDLWREPERKSATHGSRRETEGVSARGPTV
ncbi:MAG: RNA polymerase sigma factor [Thermoguttaceae bacterium]